MGKINICCASDENYAPHMVVTLLSLIENCSEVSSLRFFIFDTGIKEETLNIIKLFLKEKKVATKILKVDSKLIEDLPECGHLGKTTYVRIFIPKILNKLDKIIYLDSDLIIKGDIISLYKLIPEEKIISAVRDIGAEDFLEHIKKDHLDFNLKKDHYFNAGILLINCKRWRDFNVTKKTLKILNLKKKKIIMGDQDALNYVLAKRWEEISFEWNVNPYDFYEPLAYLKRKRLKKEYRDILHHPKIIHFGSPIKPWDFRDFHPMKKEYYIFLDKTPWAKKFPKNKSIKNYINRIKRKTIAFFPWRLRIKIKNLIRRKR